MQLQQGAALIISRCATGTHDHFKFKQDQMSVTILRTTALILCTYMSYTKADLNESIESDSE